MTEVANNVGVQSSNASSILQNPTKDNDGLYQHISINNNPCLSSIPSSLHTHHQLQVEEEVLVEGGERKRIRRHHFQQVEEQRREIYYHNNSNSNEEELSNSKLVGLFLTAFRRSVLGCSSCEINNSRSYCKGMEIGVPTNVRHVAHVTFDRFNGFLGLPVEFEPEVPSRPPSASATVFGVSTNSMQLSFDTRGNSVPTILLMMQHRLYALGGLQAEGIFRINPDNGREEYLRDQLNRGLLPDDVDVHSLAGLIKAWFRELPTGVLDCLSPEEVMQSQTEQECTELARLLPPTEAALLDWAINLMADVAQFEYLNKMNARNIAMVFAPNMTHMADPLTALMHAVQVMNFLKMLIEKTLKEREDSVLDSALDSYGRDPSGENGHHSSLQTILEEASSDTDGEEERDFRAVNPSAADHSHFDQDDSQIENIVLEENQSSVSDSKDDNELMQEKENLISKASDSNTSAAKSVIGKPPLHKSSRSGQTSTIRKGPLKNSEKSVSRVAKSGEKTKGSSLVSSMNLRTERIEAWR